MMDLKSVARKGVPVQVRPDPPPAFAYASARQARDEVLVLGKRSVSPKPRRSKTKMGRRRTEF